MSLEEKQRLLMQVTALITEEWYELGLELLKHYSCHRCADPTCCKIAAQLKEEELRDMAITKRMAPREFFNTYCQTSPLGVYLKTPCPFSEKGATSKCTMHHIRPFMCRLYPISSIPGVVLNFDICPLAKDIADDLLRVREKAMAEDYKVELTDLQQMSNRLMEEVMSALPPEMTARIGDEGNATENMINMLDEFAPKSAVKGELHDSIKTSVTIFELLLKEKRESG